MRRSFPQTLVPLAAAALVVVLTALRPAQAQRPSWAIAALRRHMRLSATTNRATPALVIPRFVIALPPRSLTVSLLADRTLRGLEDHGGHRLQRRPVGQRRRAARALSATSKHSITRSDVTRAWKC